MGRPTRQALTRTSSTQELNQARAASSERAHPPVSYSGNRAALRRLSNESPALQSQLKIGAVDDPLEAEADRVADQVLRLPDPAISVTTASPQINRKCAVCDEEDKKLHAKPDGGLATGEAPPLVHDALKSSGRPLDPATRGFMESRFGHDFGDVRIHADEKASQSAQSIGALAYATGQNIAFAPGQYRPQTATGQRLLAHELAHVVQQSRGASEAIRREGPPAGSGSAPPPGPAAPAAAPACAEAPTFVPTSKPPETILGNTVVDFLANVASQIGDPFTQPVENHDMELDGSGRVTKVNMTVEISVSRPRWGGGRGSDKDKALILKAVDLIKDHENQHVAIAKQNFAAAVCAALGKKGADAKKAIDDIVCKTMAKAQEDYDMLHGQIVVVKDANGAPSDVTTGPVATRPNYGCTAPAAAPAPAPHMQPKLVIGAVDDPLEAEADRVADQVMRMPDPAVSVASGAPQINRNCTGCEEEDKRLHAKPAGGLAKGEAPPLVHEALRTPGRPLDPATRAYFEPRFGYDFNQVRLHTDQLAIASATAVNARAYTFGHSIVFGAGRFAPYTLQGRSLLAHELAHVAQQGGGRSNSIQRETETAPPQTQAPPQAQAGAAPPANITAEDCKLAEEVCRETAVYKALSAFDKFRTETIIGILAKRPLLERLSTLVKLWVLFDTPVKSKETIAAETKADTAAAAKSEQARLANPQAANTGVEEAGSSDPARKFHKVAGPFGGRYEVDNSDPAHIYVKAKVFLFPAGKGTVDDVNQIKGMEDAIEKAASAPGYSVDIIFTTAKDADTFNVGVDPGKWEVADNWAGGDAKGYAHELHHLMAFTIDKYNYIDAHSTNQSMEVSDRLTWFKMELDKPAGFNDPTSIMADADHPNDADACTVAGLNVAACTAIRQQSRQAQPQPAAQPQAQPAGGQP